MPNCPGCEEYKESRKMCEELSSQLETAKTEIAQFEKEMEAAHSALNTFRKTPSGQGLITH